MAVILLATRPRNPGRRADLEAPSRRGLVAVYRAGRRLTALLWLPDTSCADERAHAGEVAAARGVPGVRERREHPRHKFRMTAKAFMFPMRSCVSDDQSCRSVSIGSTRRYIAKFHRISPTQ